MDKVRLFLRITWQQRFWVLSVLGVIVAIFCWYKASGALDTEFTANKAQIELKFGDMGKISQAAYLGNDAVNTRETQEAVKIRDKVRELWQKLYNSQSAKVLKWPEALGKDFLEYIDGKKFRDEIADNNMRQRYREYAKNTFPDLVKIVDAKKIPDSQLGVGGGYGGEYGGRGGFGGGVGPEIGPDGQPRQEDYLVQWQDQGVVYEKLNFKVRPTSLQIWVTQEDLWVYQTLLEAIAETNKSRGATRPDNSAIRAIMALQVGKAAAFASRQPGQILAPPAVAVAGGEAVGMEGGYGSRSDGGYGGATGEPVNLDAGLLAGRYLGPEGEPIADETGSFGVEFRRLPVRMLLRMEVPAIPSILIECANATLPIEVKRVRINSDKSGTGFASPFDASMAAGVGGEFGGRGGYGGEMGSRGGEYGGRGGGGYGGGGGGYESMTLTPDLGGKELATVEINGIVYIYNPPDPTVLSVPGGDDAIAGGEGGETVAAAAGAAPL